MVAMLNRASEPLGTSKYRPLPTRRSMVSACFTAKLWFMASARKMVDDDQMGSTRIAYLSCYTWSL